MRPDPLSFLSDELNSLKAQGLYRHLRVLDAIDDLGHVREAHRRVVAVGNDHRAIGVRSRQLIVRRDREGLLRTVERALRTRYVRASDREAEILEAQSVPGEPFHVGLDAHRRPNAALDSHVPHSRDLAQSLCQQRVCKVADARQGRRVGGERQRQNRRVGP